MLFSLPAWSTRRPIVTPVIRIRVPVTLRICVPVTLRWRFIFKFLKSSHFENHPSESIHIWTLVTLEDPLSFHDCFSVMQTIYADSWSDISWPCDINLCVMNWRSAWPIFHDPVILPYILRTIWCMNITLWDNESSKFRSQWPIIHVQWYIALRLEDYLMYEHHTSWNESVWPNLWP